MSITRKAMAATSAPDVHISAMRRRHLRSVLRIEDQVYPRPWTHGVFMGELGTHDGTRCYIVARVGTKLVGYAGFLVSMEDAHVTNIAVDPAWQRRQIGTRLLVTLAREARLRGCRNMTLEVRVSNRPAQAMYQRFGFAPAGVRAKYYENIEDAIVMWCHDIDSPAYGERLRTLEAEVSGTTTWDGVG
ncbi:MAG TPA: ribosomal protein S18-alanine N-acetyltransferase [Acidimicrobiales bacterium]